MRPATIKTISYTPGDPPTDPIELQRFLRNETNSIAAAITSLADGHLEPQAKAPNKPRAGDIRYADGVNWNPGSGEGLYRFSIAGAWVFLG